MNNNQTKLCRIRIQTLCPFLILWSLSALPCAGQSVPTSEPIPGGAILGDKRLFAEDFESQTPLSFPSSLKKGSGNMFVETDRNNKFLKLASQGYFDLLLTDELQIPFSISFDLNKVSPQGMISGNVLSIGFPTTQKESNSYMNGTIVEFGRPDISCLRDPSTQRVNSLDESGVSFNKYEGPLHCAITWTRDYVRCYVNNILFALVPASRVKSTPRSIIRIGCPSGSLSQPVVIDNFEISLYTVAREQELVAREGKDESVERQDKHSTLFSDDIQQAPADGLPTQPSYLSGAASITRVGNVNYLQISSGKFLIPLPADIGRDLEVELVFTVQRNNDKALQVHMELTGARSAESAQRPLNMPSVMLVSNWTNFSGWSSVVRSGTGAAPHRTSSDRFALDLSGATAMRIESRNSEIRVFLNDRLILNSVEDGFQELRELTLNASCKGAKILVKALNVKGLAP